MMPCFSQVGIVHDRRVGTEAHLVVSAMGKLALRLRSGVSKLEQQTDPVEGLLDVVSFACKIFELFLRIDPYVNGNGHIARLAVIALFVRFNYPRPKDWPVE